jgi:endogenous inhibitor of DNA gyrase (YacG/DUF329 family)
VNGPSRRVSPKPSRQAKGPAKSARKAGAKCPICGKQVVREFRPFCSKRCADIDLGRWLGGRYVVPGEPVARNDFDTEE